MVSPKFLFQVLPKHVRIFDSTSHRMPHNVYSFEEMQKIKVTHRPPTKASDYIALGWVKGIRFFWNTLAWYNPSRMTERQWIRYLTFVETFTGVPGMIGGMCRHLQSLRLLKHDNGWIHHLLEQADNERFHLMTFVNMRKPSYLTRLGILTWQAISMTSFFGTYLLFPKYSHRFVGYLEADLVRVYTELLGQIDNDKSWMKHWRDMKASTQAAEYYHMEAGSATMRDIVLAIRADKANHREANHYFAEVSRDLDLEEQPVIIINPGEQFVLKKQSEFSSQLKDNVKV